MKDLEQAAAILAAAEAVGAVVLLEGNKLKVRNSILLPSSVRAGVDGNWRALAELFKDDHCRCCGRLIDWRRDGSYASNSISRRSSRRIRTASLRSAAASADLRPCFQFARRLRSRPSGVRGPVLLPP
jgi:hypothetical protein